jgi:hypothetical protein
MGKMSKALLDLLGIGVVVKFMLYQFSRNSWHVSKLSCEDIPIFLEEFDEQEFLFRIQTIPHMSDLGGLIRGQHNCLAEFVLRLDEQLGSLGLGHDRVWGDSAKAFLNSWSSAGDNSMSTISQLSRS